MDFKSALHLGAIGDAHRTPSAFARRQYSRKLLQKLQRITPLDVGRRRRLAPEAVVALDWHNDMSKLILDINDRIESAADDRARGVIIRRLRRALDE